MLLSTGATNAERIVNQSKNLHLPGGTEITTKATVSVMFPLKIEQDTSRVKVRNVTPTSSPSVDVCSHSTPDLCWNNGIYSRPSYRIN